MWGVYVVVIGLPLAIAIFFLCSSGKVRNALLYLPFSVAFRVTL